MIKNLYLIRHAHYRIPHPRDLQKGDRGGTVLTVRGIEDVIELAHKLRHFDKNIFKIYTSPYKRTMETTNLLAKILRTDVVLKEDLQENYMGDGNVDHLKDVHAKFKGVVETALEQQAGNCLIVSHRFPISLYISRESGLSYEEIASDRKHINLIKMGECLKLMFNGQAFINYEKF